jgi:putative endonuclease
MFTVYVIQSCEGYNYTGMTEDIELRLKQHNEKLLSLWTKRGNGWKLVYKEEYENKTEALKREKWLKTGVGREYLKNILTQRL